MYVETTNTQDVFDKRSQRRVYRNRRRWYHTRSIQEDIRTKMKIVSNCMYSEKSSDDNKT